MIRENQILFNRLNICLDGILVVCSFLFGYWVRFYVLHDGYRSVPFRLYALVAVLLVPLHLFIYMQLGLYESRRKKRIYQELGTLFFGNMIGLLCLAVGLFIFKEVHFSRLALLIYFLTLNASVGLKRVVVHKSLDRLRSQGFNQKETLLVGSGKNARLYVEEIRRSPFFGYDLQGYVSDHWDSKIGLRRLGGMDELPRILEDLKPEEVVACLDMDEYERMPQIIQDCEKTGTKLSMVPFYAQYIPSQPQIDSLNGLPLINLRRIPLDNLGNAFLKRTMDVLGSLVLIVLTSPIMLIAAVGVKLSSPGPVIFRQKRVGLNKKEFNMYKFRSMRVNDSETTGWSTNVDSRKTKFGAFIRKCSIDELPQFFNVLRGDMSLVGPRPELPHFVNRFKEEVPRYMVKHQVRPGITGWAQVNGYRGDTSIPERIKCDIYYIENWSLSLDIKILFMTLGQVINREKL